MSLFRKEVLLNRRNVSMGDLSLNVPLSYSLIIVPIFFLIFFLILFMFTFDYSKKEKISGYLVPLEGISKIKVDRVSVLDVLHFKAGDSVRKGDVLAVISIEKGLSNGDLYSKQMFDSLSRDKSIIIEKQKLAQSRKDRIVNNLTSEKNSLLIQKENVAQQLSLSQQALTLKENHLEKTNNVFKKGIISKEQFDLVQFEALNSRQQFMQFKFRLSELDRSIKSIESEIFITSTEIEQEMLLLRSQKESLEQKELSIYTTQGYSVVAPRDGIISSVFAEEGAILEPGKVLMTIQPQESILLARMLVPSKSIGMIKVSQPAALYFSSFPYQRFGIYKGTINKISDNVLEPNEIFEQSEIRESVYIVDIIIEKQYVEAYGRKYSLKSSMKVDAEVITDRINLFDLFIEPISAFSKKSSI